MWWKCLLALGCFVLNDAPVSAQKAGKTAIVAYAAAMQVHGTVDAPEAFLRFCDRTPDDCTLSSDFGRRVLMTAERRAELDEVNTLVNSTIKPASDIQTYGVLEYWALPVTAGDCEDYSLLKRHILISRGWPPSALLMTVVLDEVGDGHAILTARTEQGDFILDNKVSDIRAWYKTGYRFVMRQSYRDPKVWFLLDPASSATPISISSLLGTR